MVRLVLLAPTLPSHCVTSLLAVYQITNSFLWSHKSLHSTLYLFCIFLYFTYAVVYPPRPANTYNVFREQDCVHHGFFSSGRTPVSAAMCPLCLLPCSSPAGVPGLPAAAGLCVAAVASVPSGTRLLSGAASEAGH